MRRRVAALGVAAAALVIGVAVTVGYSLTTGFDRAARAADLPDVVARFDSSARADVDRRVAGLPNLAARSYRYEATRQPLAANGHFTRQGVVHVLQGGRRGYALVEGYDLTGRADEVLVERGLARAWGLRLGDRLRTPFGTARIAGITVSPDNVAYPLAKTARIYVRGAGFPEANLALLWLADPARADVTLTQARAVSFGVGRLRFVTRGGIEVLLDRAAGIVLGLLVAFAAVAAIAAGTMLAAGAHAEVQRSLSAIGVRRAIGFSRADVIRGHVLGAAAVAAPAAAAGLAVGAIAVRGPVADLLSILNEQPPGAALLGPLALAWGTVVALTAAAAAWPAWRATRRAPAPLLRGGDVSSPRSRGAGHVGGPFLTGARFAAAHRARLAGTALTLAVCGGVVLLMLALASLLTRLRDDPAAVGKRYSYAVRAPESLEPSIAAIPGVAEVGRRYVTEAADSFRLDQPLRVVGYDAPPSRFEVPPLEDGRRARRDGEAEVGRGLADVLGLRPGSPMAVQLPSGAEMRLTVSGIVRGLENDGRAVWMRAGPLLAAQPGLPSQLAIVLRPGADRGRVDAGLRALDVDPARPGGATTRDPTLLGILAAVLRSVALAVALVCLYALVQGLAMTARERRGAIAVLRAVGGGRREVALLLGGAAAVVAIPSAAGAIALGVLAFAPAVASAAAGYAGLPLAPSATQAGMVLLGFALLAAAATAFVARAVLAEPVVAGLRDR